MPPKNKGKGKKGGKDDFEPTVTKQEKLKQIQENKKNDNPHEGLPAYLTEGTTQKDRDVILDFTLSTPNNSRILVNQATLRLVYGRRYGLIGQNGIGKTTLLNAISQYKLPGFPQYLRVVHVKQDEIPRDDLSVPVIQYVIQSDEVKNFLEKEEQRLLDLMEGSNNQDAGDSDADVDMSEFTKYEQQLDEVYRRLDAIGARTAEARARAILTGLQFTQEMQDGSLSKLSGGWKMRVRLACALFVTPDILLLDEPTNHLDFPACEWLAGFLKVYEATLLVVSHDRGFLDSIMTDCIDFRDQTLMYYRGDYTNYVKVRAETIKRHNKLWEKTEKKRQALHKFIMEARQKAKDDPNLAEMAKTRQRILDALPVMHEIKEDKHINFTFPDPGSLDHAIVNCKNMSFHYKPDADGSPEKPYLLNNIDAYIDLESRIGVLGANGAGKTTLINVLLGKYPPSVGEVKLNDQARAKIFTQHHLDQLDNTMSALEFLQHKFPKENEGRLRGYLGKFGFDKILAEQKIEKLSGGQKSRVAFAVLTFQQPHLVIMDEPTNHLDIDTVDALIEALRGFKGGVIVISHDRYFLQSIADEYWAVDAKGTMQVHHDLEDAKAYAYKPIEFKPDGLMVKKSALHKADPNKQKQYDVENAEDIRYRELESVFNEDDDDDDADDEAILASLDKKSEQLAKLQKQQKQAQDKAAAALNREKAKKGSMYHMDLPMDLPKTNYNNNNNNNKKNKYDDSEDEVVVAVKKGGLAAAFALLSDDESEDEVSESEDEPVKYVPVVAPKNQPGKKKESQQAIQARQKAAEQKRLEREQREKEEAERKAEEERIAAEKAAAEAAAAAAAAAPKKKKAKKGGKKAQDDDEDDGMLDMLAGLAADLGEEEAQPAATKQKKKKGKKAAVEEDEAMDVDMGDLGAMFDGLDLAAAEEETQPAAKPKKKKAKKAAVEEDEAMDVDMGDLGAMFDGLDLAAAEEETQPVAKPKKKKAKKAAEDEAMDVDMGDLGAMFDGLDLAAAEEETQPAAKPKKKKAKKATADDDNEDAMADMLANLASTLVDEEEAALQQEEKLKKKKAKKAKQAEQEAEEEEVAQQQTKRRMK